MQGVFKEPHGKINSFCVLLKSWQALPQPRGSISTLDWTHAMKIEHVQINVVKHEEGKKVISSEVFLTCGKPYINCGFHVEGDAKIEAGIYTLSFEPQKAAKG